MNALWPYLAVAVVLSTGTAVAQSETSAPAAPAPAAPAPPGEGAPLPPAPLPPTPPPAVPAPAPAPEPRPPLAESPLVAGPKIDLSVPEATPPVVRKVRNHDGFYLRASAGVGYRSASVSSDDVIVPSYTVNGAGISIDLLIGGTPSPGLAIGGALSLQSVSDGGDVNVEGAPNAQSGSGGVLLIGPFVDGFPMANRGFHLGGMAGLAGAGARRQGEPEEFNGGGLGGAVWIGHGFWVADEWTLGFDLKFDGAFTGDSSGPTDLTNSIYGVSLLFTGLYH